MRVNALQLISSNYNHFLDVAYSISRCHVLKNDIVNDAFLRLHSLLQKNPDKEINEGYIYLTMKSVFISMKRAKKEISQESSFFVTLIDDDSDRTENRIKVDSALNKIPFINREVLLKSQEVGMKQISRESDVPYCRVRSIRKEGMQMLENKLKKVI